jgi:hypothetical protein
VIFVRERHILHSVWSVRRALLDTQTMQTTSSKLTLMNALFSTEGATGLAKKLVHVTTDHAGAHAGTSQGHFDVGNVRPGFS